MGTTLGRAWAGLLALLLIAFSPPASAEELPTSTLGSELRRFLHDEATATVHVRSSLLSGNFAEGVGYRTDKEGENGF